MSQKETFNVLKSASEIIWQKWTYSRCILSIDMQFVVNKAKGRISKQVLQENKARQIFPKNENFLPCAN